MKDQKELEPVTLVNLVENAKPNVTANDRLAEDVFIPVVDAITGSVKVGARGSKCGLIIGVWVIPVVARPEDMPS